MATEAAALRFDLGWTSLFTFTAQRLIIPSGRIAEGDPQPMEKQMPSTNRRIGIIGLGFGAQVYLPAFRSEGWDVAAICSRSQLFA